MTNDSNVRVAREVGASARTLPAGAGRSMRNLATAFAMAGLIGLGGCGAFKGGESRYPSPEGTGPTNPNPTGERQTIFGSDGITLFGGDSKADQGTASHGGPRREIQQIDRHDFLLRLVFGCGQYS